MYKGILILILLLWGGFMLYGLYLMYNITY